MPNKTATVGETVQLTCTVENFVQSSAAEFQFLQDDKLVQSTIYTGNTTSSNVLRLTIQNTIEYVLQLGTFTCSMAGTFTCRILRGSTIIVETSMVLTVSSLPAKPTITWRGTASSKTLECRTTYLGFNPDYQFEWRQRDNNSNVAPLPPNMTPQDSYPSPNPSCSDNYGTSILTPSSFADLDYSKLCCRLVNGGNVSVETCTEETIYMPDVQGLADATVVIGSDFTLACTVSHLRFLTSINILYNGTVAGTLDYENNVASFSNGSLSLSSQTSNDVVTVTVTVSSVSCSAAGTYTCQAVSSGHTDESSMMLQLTSPPGTPVVSIDPDLAEGQASAFLPRCTVSSLGYNPEHTFLWVIKRNNGSVVENTPSGYTTTNTFTNSATPCLRRATSDLNTNAYVGLNNSQLCCRLVRDTTNSSSYVAEACTDTIRLVPGNICTAINNDTSFINPLGDGCYKYIQCVTGRSTVFFQKCAEGGAFCFDPVTRNCDKPRNGTGTEPFKCTVGGPEYMPFSYTFPNNCTAYQRCVNGISYAQVCQGNTEFSEGAFPCDNPSNTTYCGKLRQSITTTTTTTVENTGSTNATTATTTYSTTTQDPFKCTINSPQYMPYSYTFPSNCTAYQWCVSGRSYPQVCVGNTEFSEVAVNPCDTPSNTTYCGKLRPSTPTTTTADGVANATTAATTYNTTAPDPFKCRVGGPTYIPYSFTFPSNCSAYQWCSNGITYVGGCPAGTEFSEVVSDSPCQAPSSTTYCGKLRSTPTTTTTAGGMTLTAGLTDTTASTTTAASTPSG